VFDVVLWHDGVRSEIEGYGGDPESPTFVAHGWSRGWARNGVLTYEARYEDGGPVGTARYWNEEGTLVEEHVFHDDENARDVNRQRVNKPGFQYATIKVYERGVLVQMRTYEDGRLEGKEYEYYSDGKIKIIKMWKRGEQIGKAQEYGRDGKAIENEE
jgi:antitoxin component YwqK of YwqJK toxin-antitoxin module